MTSQAPLPAASPAYSQPAKILHWLIALLILGLLVMGFLMGTMAFGPAKMSVIMLHKSFGVTVLGLVILRILWRFAHPPPPPLSGHASWEKFLSKLIHVFLYFAMIAMPLSGWIMSSAADYPVNFFGLFDLPLIAPKDEALGHKAGAVHEILAIALYFAVGLHFVGAAKHHLLDKDATLARMGGNLVFLVAGAALLLAASYLVGNKYLMPKPQAGHGEAAAPTTSQPAAQTATQATTQPDENAALWHIVPEQSSIQFKFLQYGQKVQGQFNAFKGRILFDPDNLAAAEAHIVIEAQSISTGSEDRDAQARSADWFGVEEFPLAVFQSESFAHIEGDQYTARGDLTIRGAVMPIVLPFTLEMSENKDGVRSAKMDAHIALMRLDFGVGQGEWESTDSIGNDVEVDIVLHVTK